MMAIVTPVFSYLEPLVRVVKHLGLANSRTAVILTTTATFLPVPTLLMRSFFLTTAGRNLATLDASKAPANGESSGTSWRHLARSGILTVLIFAFLVELERSIAAGCLPPIARQIYYRLCHYHAQAGWVSPGSRYHVCRFDHINRPDDRRISFAHAAIYRRTDRWRFARLESPTASDCI